jgi:hypothetical protein
MKQINRKDFFRFAGGEYAVFHLPVEELLSFLAILSKLIQVAPGNKHTILLVT